MENEIESNDILRKIYESENQIKDMLESILDSLWNIDIILERE